MSLKFVSAFLRNIYNSIKMSAEAVVNAEVLKIEEVSTIVGELSTPPSSSACDANTPHVALFVLKVSLLLLLYCFKLQEKKVEAPVMEGEGRSFRGFRGQFRTSC